MKPRLRKVIFFEGNNLTPVSSLHEQLFASRICCSLSEARQTGEKETRMISGVLGIMGNMALLQGS